MKVKGAFTLQPLKALPEDEAFVDDDYWTIDINPKSGNLNFKGVDAEGNERWHWPNFPPTPSMSEPMRKRLVAEGRRMPDGALE